MCPVVSITNVPDGMIICPHCGGQIPLVVNCQVRTAEAEHLLARISQAIAEERYVLARKMVSELTQLVGENDPEVIRTETLLSFLAEDLA